MNCPLCGKDSPPETNYCPSCGCALTPASPGARPIAPPQPEQRSGEAIASLTLGLIGLVGWCIPIVGLPMSITGVVLGARSLKSASRNMALAGLILCSIGLVAGLVNAGIGAYLGATGQHPLMKQRQPTSSNAQAMLPKAGAVRFTVVQPPATYPIMPNV